MALYSGLYTKLPPCLGTTSERLTMGKELKLHTLLARHEFGSVSFTFRSGTGNKVRPSPANHNSFTSVSLSLFELRPRSSQLI